MVINERPPLVSTNSIISMTSSIRSNFSSTSNASRASTTPQEPIANVLKDIDFLMTQFLKNKFDVALTTVDMKKNDHCYYQFLRAYFYTTKGLVTFEEDALEHGLQACQEALNYCDRRRRSRLGLLKLIWSPNYNQYTEEEVHAEICYATIAAFTSILTLVVEKSIIGLVKAGYRIKASYDVLRSSSDIADSRTNWESDYSRQTFKNGIQILRGVFTLLTSHLPTRVLRLVQFLGFDGNRRAALRELTDALVADQIWSPVAALLLLAYNTQIEYVIGLGEGNMALVEQILDVYLVEKKFDTSGFFLIFSGLFEQIRGRPDLAIGTFEKSITAFAEWPQLQNAGYWFMIWAYAVQSDWDNAARYAALMVDICKWSPATSTYQLASFLYMKNSTAIQNGSNIDFNKTKADVSELLRRAPALKHNVAGKTIFVEKFVTKRCQIYFDDNEQLTLPVLELFLLWNVFPMMRNTPESLKRIKSSIDDKLKEFDGRVPSKNVDNYNYLRFMRGVTLRCMDMPGEAIKDLSTVVKAKLSIHHAHLAPQACLELGLIAKELKDFSEAKRWLEKARTNYSKYLNETLVQLRVHCALMAIKDEQDRQRRDSKKSISFIGESLPPPSYVHSNHARRTNS